MERATADDVSLKDVSTGIRMMVMMIPTRPKVPQHTTTMMKERISSVIFVKRKEI
jgi:hypothetical protein